MHIDHLGIYVPKAIFERTIEFYSAVLVPLDYKVLMRPFPTVVGFGKESGHPDFWVTAKDVEEANVPVHFAFSTTDRKVVDEFHKAALASGGKDNGAPGTREMYHPNYYGAFVIDPVGNNVEMVCHVPPSS